jgi:hypothetical protein
MDFARQLGVIGDERKVDEVGRNHSDRHSVEKRCRRAIRVDWTMDIG